MCKLVDSPAMDQVSAGNATARGAAAQRPPSARIVLIAGPVKEHDRTGHHDYSGGCRLLAALLSRVNGVETVLVSGGWPEDESVFEGAAVMVFYDKGGGRQGFLASPERADLVERAAYNGTGVVVIHQAVGFPGRYVDLGKRLLGGVYMSGVSRRGHWSSRHLDFPSHPVTRGVEPWSGADGWLNHIQFNDDSGIVPLLWSGKRFGGSPGGGTHDIVAWAYQRQGGGRSFVYTGLDSHAAFSHPGLRRLVAGGILWAAGVEIPEGGVPVDMDETCLRAFLTPRRSPWLRLPRKIFRRLTGHKRW